MRCVTLYLTKNVFLSTVISTGTLVSIAWLTQTLRFIDLVLSKGLPLRAFLSLTLCLTPDLIVTILPFGMLFGSLFAFYRLQGNGEIMICKALGASTMALLKGPLLLSVALSIVGIMMNMFLSPTSFRYLKDKEHALRQIDSPLHLRSQVFQPLGKVMVYIRDVKRNGHLYGILVYDKHRSESTTTYTAERGIWALTNNTLRLMLFNGTQQQFSTKGRPPEILEFREYYLDLQQNRIQPRTGQRKPFELDLLDILRVPFDTTYGKILVLEIHRRILSPLMGVVFVFFGLTLMLVVPYNRKSSMRPVIFAILLNTLLQIAMMSLLNRGNNELIWGTYIILFSGAGFVVACTKYKKVYATSKSFFLFLGQKFCSKMTLEKLRISPMFKAFSMVVSGENIKPKNRKNDREEV